MGSTSTSDEAISFKTAADSSFKSGAGSSFKSAGDSFTWQDAADGFRCVPKAAESVLSRAGVGTREGACINSHSIVLEASSPRDGALPLAAAAALGKLPAKDRGGVVKI